MHLRARILPPGAPVKRIRLEAPSLTAARAQLAQDGAVVLSLAPELPWRLPVRPRFPVPLFTQELVALLEAGLTLGAALAVLTDQAARPEARGVLAALRASLEAGRPFSDGLATQGGVFPTLYVATVRAAERTGALVPALTRYLDYHERVDRLRKQVQNAAIYPALLLGVGTLVIGFLLTYVVPRFATIYANAGRTPPWSTRLLIALGEGLTHHGGLLAGLLAALGVGGAAALRRPAVRVRLGARLWRLPRVGAALHRFQLARFYRALGLLLEGGIPLVAALDGVAQLLPAALRAGVGEAREALRRGEPLARSFAAAALTTPVALRLLQVAEQAGELGPMTGRIAQFYDEATARTVDWITRLFEPLLMVFVGLVVGGVVVLLYLPIFDLTGAFQ